MDNLKRAVLWLLTSLPAWALALVPCVLLVLMAGSYFYWLFQTALAPGVPVAFEYEAEGGTVRAFADSYRIDPKTSTIHIFGMQLNPMGEEASIRAKHVTVSLSAPMTEIKIQEGDVQLDRREDGTFNLARLAPKSTEVSGPKPLLILVYKSKLKYLDLTSNEVLTETADIAFGRIQVFGEDIVATTSPRIAGIGQVPLQLWITKGGEAKTEIAFPRLSASRIWKHVSRWIDRRDAESLQDVQFGDLQISGDLVLHFGKQFRLDASAKFDAKNAGLKGIWTDASVRGDVRASGTRADIHAFAKDNTNSAEFQGRLDWTKGFASSGDFVVHSNSRRTLLPEISQSLPKELDFQRGSWRGKLAYAKGKLILDGTIIAQSVGWGAEKLARPVAHLRVTDSGFYVAASSLKLRDLPIGGAVAWSKTSGVSGYVRGEKLPLEKIASEAGIEGVRGEGSVAAVFGGSVKKPTVDLRIVGAATVKVEEDRWLYAGLFDSRVGWQSNRWTINRFAVSGPNGGAVVSGDYNTTSKSLNLAVSGGGLALQAFDPRLGGLGFLEARVTGTIDEPLFAGNARAFGVSVDEQSIPAVATQFTATRHDLQLNQFAALIGTGRVIGKGTLSFSDSIITGTADVENVQISDWLPDYAGGLIQARNIRISGTLDEPKATGELTAAKLVVQGIDLDNGIAQFEIDRHLLRISRASVSVLGDGDEEGTVTAEGQYDFDRKSGTFIGSVIEAPASVLVTSNEGLSFGGRVSGGLNGSFSDGKLHTLDSDWRLEAASVNDNPIGTGFAEAKFADGTWTGSGQIGQLDRYVQVLSASFNPETRQVFGETDVTNLNLKDFALIFRRQISSLPASGQRIVLGTEGDMSASATFSGTTDSLDVSVSALNASNLTILGRDAGVINFAATRRNRIWEIGTLAWKIADSDIKGGGVIDEGGDTAFDLDAYNVDLSWLNTLGLVSQSLIGSADLSLAASGRTEKPRIVGTLHTNNIGFLEESGTQNKLPLAVSLDTVELNNDRVTASGTFNLSGFAGLISAEGALASLTPYNPEVGPDTSTDDFRADLSLVQRNLADLAEIAPWIDQSVSKGGVSGAIQISKSGGKFELDGQIGITAEVLKSLDTNARLQDLTANVRFSDSEAVAEVKSSVNEDGSLVARLGADLGDIFAGGIGLREKLSRMPLSGSLRVENVPIAEASKKRDFIARGTIAGALDIGGSLLQPRISGDVGVAGLDLALLGELTSSAGATAPLVNPQFANIRFYAQDIAHFRTTTADVYLLGSGTVNGNLEYPSIRSLFTLQRGTYQLPLSRIRLQEGGTIQFIYEPSQFATNSARLDVDLDGRTRIVASPTAGTFESYDVDISFRGNLLEDGGLTLTATSDPPGLTQPQILAAIGQAGLLEEFARGKFREGVGILFGQYLPQLIGRQTAELARGLKLDYISIDYSPNGSFVLSGAKSLGRNLILQMTREVAGRLQRVPKYEVKLTYRIPVKNQLLEKTRLGFGFDQSNPWKVSLDYATRLWSFQLSKRTSDGKTWQRVWP